MDTDSFCRKVLGRSLITLSDWIKQNRDVFLKRVGNAVKLSEALTEYEEEQGIRASQRPGLKLPRIAGTLTTHSH
jgi:hypothetical protein